MRGPSARKSLAPVLALMAASVSAAEGSAASSGPWIFASVALALVAGLAYALGRAYRAPAAEGSGPSVRTDATLSSMVNLMQGRLQLFERRNDAPGMPWQMLSGSGAQAPGLPAQSDVPPGEAPPFNAQSAAVKALQPGDRATLSGWAVCCVREDTRDVLMAWHTETGSGSGVRDLQALTTSVSHDLRAPVRVVDGFARILKEDYGRQLDRIGNDHLDRVLAACARMNAMIEGVLALARISDQPLARQPVNLSQMAAFVVEDLRRASPQRQVGVDIEDGLEVMADPTLMRQLMDNLLSNAWKYTTKSEPARISVRASTDADGRRVIEVGDNGAGFDMRSADRLFGLFQRLHASHDFPGTGVGLASVQRIVRRHGGDIWADSAPGQGARFRFTLG